ncbi:MAG TPA: radical SAM protein, partial [Terriglobales bacterium]|nr:radical SAM protein [Terriglobales bacterium]
GDLGDIPGVSFLDGDRVVTTAPPALTMNLDEYPMPSWHKLPMAKHWEISRIWGGKTGWMDDVAHPRWASIFTSRGCPFRCAYCHVSLERGGEAGDIATLRLHSLERLEQELIELRELGVEYVYVNDDSFLAKRERVRRVLRLLERYRFRLADVNGVNIVHLFRRQGSRLVVDEDLLERLYAGGFRKLSLPFESGSQRLLDKYSTGKWNIAECNFETLIAKMVRIGIVLDGNFMIGYPDESLEELTETFLLARRVMDAGAIAVSFFMVQPFPGSRLYEEAIANNQLRPDWSWDDLGWSKGSPFARPLISNETLSYCWSLVWKLLNSQPRVEEMQSQMPDAEVLPRFSIPSRSAGA